jgi:GxxExxY protein
MDTKEQANLLSRQIIGAAIEVHKTLGPGLLESAYQNCHKHELGLRGVPVQTEVPLPLEYKGFRLDCGYRMDELVGGLVIVEIKSVERIEPIHEAQLLTYLRLSGLWLGLLINFNAPVLKNGIKRLVLG